MGEDVSEDGKSATAGPPREGSLDAPFRHPIAWQDDDYYDLAKVEAEMERQFDVCHTCRRCFNLCDSFPRLFDLIDESKTGELDSVPKSDYAKVDEACTLCDMCFLTKCPYVPPHSFDIDIPHLILRYRAAKRRAGEKQFVREQLGLTDRNGKLAKPVARIANWATARKNTPLRKLLEAIAQIDAEAELPKYHSRTATDRLKSPLAPNPDGPAFGQRKVALYATCFVDYNEPDTAVAAARVLALQGVEVKLVYPECCGMPQLEAGDLKDVAGRAGRVAKVFAPLIAEGYDVVALTASCGLMMKFEWPLIEPANKEVVALSAATKDVCEYVVDLQKTFGLAEGLTPVEGGITLHHACHARAQNMGAKSAEMLRLIPETRVELVERCSGHGGTFGVMKATHPVANKVGRPAARQIAQKGTETLCSDCPLACKHLGQLLTAETSPDTHAAPRQAHPIEIFARAYAL
ncbi:MAG TPA: heterodisulfide reductase-related iron-sulfur binding cluster [Phenylobacterium sp.]|jgi:glycerol-3-phosphate dehydrogenase subunit C|uniref:heterodisulfide reductase-related iron-sulfur binding cluster n=1 Tax=Phenylobacterium sp. TaxID=1871053 RepID=UPI002D6D9CA8|nr:heterodisulfide reductase-related iron-sulfur binding cluster [Phenylobacterium sp.]HZZ69794.1 heterodisulfide reductase-related iron-sulfur binding cluster [Phenylobacterium sp.]